MVPLHVTRRIYAELALGANVRLDVVSLQLGHASISTTANVYSHDTTGQRPKRPTGSDTSWVRRSAVQDPPGNRTGPSIGADPHEG